MKYRIQLGDNRKIIVPATSVWRPFLAHRTAHDVGDAVTVRIVERLHILGTDEMIERAVKPESALVLEVLPD